MSWIYYHKYYQCLFFHWWHMSRQSHVLFGLFLCGLAALVGVICSLDTDSSAVLLNTACLFNYGKQELCIFSQACQFNITEARTYSPTPEKSGFSWVNIFICTHQGRWVALRVSWGSVHSRAGRKTSQRAVCAWVLARFYVRKEALTIERAEFLVLRCTPSSRYKLQARSTSLMWLYIFYVQ